MIQLPRLGGRSCIVQSPQTGLYSIQENWLNLSLIVFELTSISRLQSSAFGVAEKRRESERPRQGETWYIVEKNTSVPFFDDTPSEV